MQSGRFRYWYCSHHFFPDLPRKRSPSRVKNLTISRNQVLKPFEPFFRGDVDGAGRRPCHRVSGVWILAFGEAKLQKSAMRFSLDTSLSALRQSALDCDRVKPYLSVMQRNINATAVTVTAVTKKLTTQRITTSKIQLIYCTSIPRHPA